MMITSSNRYARASAAIQSGGPVLVGDEAHPDQAGLAAIAGRASGAALELLGAEGREIRDLENRPGGALARHAIEAAAGDLAGGGAVLFARVGLGGLLAKDRAAERLASDLAVPFVTVEDVVEHRLRTETIVEEVAEAALPSRYAAGLRVRAFRTIADGTEHLALVHRPGIGFGPEPLVRLHSECLTGDALGSLRCDCGEQLRGALDAITRDPQGGAVLYLRGQEGRGIGLANKIRAYALQENGRDTVDANLELGFPADARDYGIAAAMLQALGIGRVRLLSNNPAKRAALVRYGIDVPERRELRFDTNPYNAFYLDTKRKRMGHDLPAGPRGDSR